MTCVCGHTEWAHHRLAPTPPFQRCWWCTCSIYEPDDGTPSHLGTLRTEPYVGIYARSYTL